MRNAMRTQSIVFVALLMLPLAMFEQELASGRLLQPFAQTLELGRYWLTRLRSRPESGAAARLRQWLEDEGGER
jgi:LysR family transcriptional regulator of beta-lactamase